MQNQLPLFLPYDHVHALPIVLKYQKIFDQLDLSDLPEFNGGIGANGTSQHALLQRIFNSIPGKPQNRPCAHSLFNSQPCAYLSLRLPQSNHYPMTLNSTVSLKKPNTR